MAKKKQGVKGESVIESYLEIGEKKLDVKSIVKDVEFLGSSHMRWRERKDLESRKVISLGGKPPKKQRLPLSVARAMMKNQKKREQKMLEESSILGRFERMLGNGMKRTTERRKPEDRVLKSTEGHFRNGVLDVKHLLRPSASGVSDDGSHRMSKGKKGRKGGKNDRVKKNGGGRKHH